MGVLGRETGRRRMGDGRVSVVGCGGEVLWGLPLGNVMALGIWGDVGVRFTAPSSAEARLRRSMGWRGHVAGLDIAAVV